MKSGKYGMVAALVGALLVLSAALVEPARAQTAQKAIVLAWDGDRVTSIRDFRYVPYIASEATFTRSVDGADPSTHSVRSG